MAISESIPKTLNLNPGEDFSFLLKTGMGIIKELAGEYWTDYNEHDPGITILEQLAYALTEIGLKANLPVKDIICNNDGSINGRQNFFFTAAEILSSKAITCEDYRRLLIDKFPEINNAWVNMPVKAQYEVLIAMRTVITNPHEVLEKEKEIISFLNSNRNLAEVFTSVKILKPQLIAIAGKIQVSKAANLENIAENILNGLNALITPPVKLNTLNEMIGAGCHTEDIFLGPAPARGFIPKDGLVDKVTEVRISQVLREIIAIPQVHDIEELSFVTQSGTDNLLNTITIPDDSVAILDVKTTIDKLMLYSTNVRLFPLIKYVKSNYYNKKDEKVSPYPLQTGPEAMDIAIPNGKYTDVANYYSIKNQFPYIYGLNKQYVERGVSQERRASILQLKAYLSFFEQHMANSLAQLAGAKDLFNLNSGNKSYFVQPITDYIGMNKILDKSYLDELENQVNTPDKNAQRSNLFLNHVLARFAESIISSDLKKDNELDAQDLPDWNHKTKLELLKIFPQYSSAKAQAPGYKIEDKKVVQSDFTGIELKMQHLLNLKKGNRKTAHVVKSFFIIEHCLLKTAEKINSLPEGFYQSVVSFVVLLDNKEFNEANYKQYISESIGRLCPAHLWPNIIFFDKDSVLVADEFKKLFYDWILHQAHPITDAKKTEANKWLAIFLNLHRSR